MHCPRAKLTSLFEVAATGVKLQAATSRNATVALELQDANMNASTALQSQVATNKNATLEWEVQATTNMNETVALELQNATIINTSDVVKSSIAQMKTHHVVRKFVLFGMCLSRFNNWTNNIHIFRDKCCISLTIVLLLHISGSPSSMISARCWLVVAWHWSPEMESLKEIGSLERHHLSG